MSVDKTKGLRQRPTYNELIEEIQLDEKIKLPNRQAKFLRESPYLSFLDGESYTDMMAEQQQTDKQVQVEHAIREQASSSSSASASELRGVQEGTSKMDRVKDMLAGGKSKLASLFSGGGSASASSSSYDVAAGKKQEGAVGVGGTWDPDDGWKPQPDPLKDWHMAPTAKGKSSQPNLPDSFGLPAKVPAELKKYETKVSKISSIISNHMGDAPHGNLIHSLMNNPTDTTMEVRGTGRVDPFGQSGGKKSRGKNLDDEFNDLMKDVAPNMKVAQDRLEKEYENLMTDVGRKKTENLKDDKSKVKTNPKFEKKKTEDKPRTGPKINPQTGYADHGTELDKSKDKTHWNKKGLGYIKDQLEKRGYKLPNSKFRGKGALNKGDLLKMIYKHDKLN